MSKIGKSLLILLVMFVFAGSGWAAEDVPQRMTTGSQLVMQSTIQTATPSDGTRMPGHTDNVPSALHGQAGTWVAPRNGNSHLDFEPVVWVDDSYTGSEIGYGVTLFNTIQAGIDGVASGGTVNVYPGTYAETAPGSILFNATGPYQFGLFVADDKSGITIQGVDGGGLPVTSYAGVLATVSLFATNSFGTSGMFVEGDDVTVTGLDLYTIVNQNKTIEVIGDNFTFKWNKITDGMSLYLNDWRYDTGLDVSWLQSYTIDGNLFDLGTSIDIASGAGFSGPVSGRQIINNDFEMDWPAYVDDWAAISFNGSGSGVPWFVYSTGAAVITGNTFNYAEGFYIRHRGTFANPADFDWVSYWNDNSFDKKVAFGTNPPTAMGTYSYPNTYGVFTDVKEIGANIQREIDWSANGDVVLCGDGTYSETPVVNKSLTLVSENLHGANIVLQSGITYTDALLIWADNVTVDGFTVTGHDAASPVLASTNFYVEVGSDNASILNNLILVGNIDGGTTGDDGFGLITPYSGTVIINDLLVSGNTFEGVNTVGRRAFYINPGVDGFTFTQNNVSDMAARAGIQARNAIVEENTVTGIGAAGSRGGGFFTWGYPDGTWGNTQFLRNTISGCYNGIAILSTNDCVVEENFLSSNDYGVWFEDYFSVWTPLTNTVFNNSITGSHFLAISNNFTLVNASANWYGVNTPAGVAALVSPGVVDYTPFLDSGTDTSITAGFQGDFHVLDVAAASPQSGLANYIQEAIDLTVGSTINLSAGTFTGQVVATGFADLNIVGAGVGSTVIKAPAAAMTAFFTTAGPNNNYPILFCNNSHVDVSNLTVDGDGKGNANYRFVGAGFWNSEGSMTNCEVINVEDTPFSGAQHGVAIYASNDVVDTYDIALTNVTVTDYQKSGVVLYGDGLTVDLDNVVVNGKGDTPVTAQNGISIGFSADGTVNDCQVYGNSWIGTPWTASGILLYESGTVDITGTVMSGNQTSVYAQDSDGSFDGGTITGNANSMEGILVYNYNPLNLSVTGHPLAQPLMDGQISKEQGSSALDDNQTFDVSNTDLTTGGAVSWGLDFYGGTGTMGVTADNCTVVGWGTGAACTNGGGSVSASITNSSFTNADNTYDNNAGNTWDSNCYSDFSTNGGFPTTYQVDGGAGNVDNNPNPNSCASVDFIVSSTYIGCETACSGDTLYLTFDQIGFITGQVFVQLPAQLDANWAPGNAYQNVYPGANVATNLQFAAARRSAGNQIEVNVTWGPPYSDGNGTKYIACIPLKTVGVVVDDQVLTISAASTVFYDISGPYTNVFMLGTTNIIVDCEDPGATIAYTTAPTCTGYNSAVAIENLFTINVTQGLPTNSLLASAYVRVDGNVGQQITLFNAPQGNYTNASFPNSGQATTIWAWLTAEGCHTLEVVATDAECNEYITAAVTLTKDTDAPDLMVTNTSSFCYNNTTGSAQYGGDYLDDYLDITTVLNSNALGAGCYAGTGTLDISYLGGSPMTVVLDLTNYPDAGTITALWTWMMTQVSVLANGENYTFDLEACDCAGNCVTSSFTICIDRTMPGNAFTLFNARPTDQGVWLQWAWTYNTAPAFALKAEIWRSNYTTEYPLYPNSMWSNLANPVNYPTSYPPAGYSLVATQLGNVSTTSTLFSGLNGKGNNIHGGTGSAYWQDEDASWIDESEDRDVYRYVTFVQDGGGNWSSVGSYTLNANADRATNYWLGDYTREVTTSPDASDGDVFSADLSLLSGVYFTSTVAGGGLTPNFYDIGPENAENGVGKGESTPDGLINFSDLIPFSFNFGTTGPSTFSVPMLPPVAFSNLDETPSLVTSLRTQAIEGPDASVLVTVELTGNSSGVVKALESQLKYDADVLEVVSVTAGGVEVNGGLPWTHARDLDGTGTIIIAAAAMGDGATISSDATLAMIEFRWVSESIGVTELELVNSQMADGVAEIVGGVGSTLSIRNNGIVPTEFSLGQNFPNPFNPETSIPFSLADASIVNLTVYNVLGQAVRTLVDQQMVAGIHRVNWDGRNDNGQMVGSGVYVYRITAGNFTKAHKMMFAR